MRVGVAVHERHVVAALMRADGTYTTLASPVTGGRIERSVDLLLERIARSEQSVSSVAFDVSGVLNHSEAAPLAVVRIAPRPPVAFADEPRSGETPILHVRGGHTTLGEELANSDAFAQCQVEKVFRTVCLRAPSDAADVDQVEQIVTAFKSSGYKLKTAFAESAAR